MCVPDANLCRHLLRGDLGEKPKSSKVTGTTHHGHLHVWKTPDWNVTAAAEGESAFYFEIPFTSLIVCAVMSVKVCQDAFNLHGDAGNRRQGGCLHGENVTLLRGFN